MPDFEFTEILPLGKDETPYRLLTRDHVSTFEAAGKTFLQVEPAALTLLTREAMREIAHLLRPGHLAQLRKILDDEAASPNDKFVALDLLKNANIAAGGVLPMCQDTGTAIVMGKKGEYVITGGGDERAIARGVFDTYATSNLRYSQMAALDMYREVNTGNNLPAQIELYATDGDAYKFLFMAKGGGSANKSYLYQETKALLNPDSLLKARHRRLPALPPRHRDRRHQRGARPQDGQVRLGALPRYAAHERRQARARLSRRGAGAENPRARAAHRHRRAVRREVLLPRRARGAPAAPRRFLPGGHRGVVLCRPPVPGQDHEGRRVPRTARARPRQVPARHHRRSPFGHRGADRPEPPHERDPRRAVALSREDAAVPVGLADRGARHRPRQAQGAARPRRGLAGVHEEPGRVLRRPRQDAGGLRLGLLRAHHGAWTPTWTPSRRPAAAW